MAEERDIKGRRTLVSHAVAALALVVVPLGSRVRFYCTPKSNKWRKETRRGLLEGPPEDSRNSIQNLHKALHGIHGVHLFTIVSMAFMAEPPTYTTNNTTSVANTKYSSPLKV